LLLSLIASVVRCSASVREELIVERLAEDKYIHPWRYWHTEENAGIPV
jgi:hypothetical protein